MEATMIRMWKKVMIKRNRVERKIIKRVYCKMQIKKISTEHYSKGGDRVNATVRRKRNQNPGYSSDTSVMYVQKRTLSDGTDGIRQRNVTISIGSVALRIVDMRSDV